jgi:CRP/FNR family transcriptional regulator, cyclic AMP receptor protein
MVYQLRVIPKKRRRATLAHPARRIPHDLQAMESSVRRCAVKEETFSDLPEPARAALDEISSPVTYSKEAILFVEGEKPSGVFVLCNGSVRLTTASADGKSMLVRIAEPGELVGLPGALSGKTHELTAEAVERVQANFIPRVALLQFLQANGGAALRVAEVLNDIYRSTLLEVRYLSFSGSTAEKLARFLLDLPATAPQTNGHLRASLGLTHKEIGEMIGASRETVTRLLGRFKRERLIEVQGSTLMVPSKANLEKLLDV